MQVSYIPNPLSYVFGFFGFVAGLVATAIFTPDAFYMGTWFWFPALGAFWFFAYHYAKVIDLRREKEAYRVFQVEEENRILKDKIANLKEGLDEDGRSL